MTREIVETATLRADIAVGVAAWSALSNYGKPDAALVARFAPFAGRSVTVIARDDYCYVVRLGEFAHRVPRAFCSEVRQTKRSPF